MADSIIATVGGKHWLKNQIIPYFYKPHEAYIEVFGGAAHILLEKEPSNVEVYNDISGDLYAFFKVLREDSDKFLFAVEMTPYCRRTFNELKAMKPVDEFEQAWRFYCLNRMAFGAYRPDKATFGYGVERKLAFHKFERVMPVVRRLHNVTIENLDFRDIFRKYDGENVLFYCDPPYYGSESKYNGDYGFSDKDHLDLLKCLQELKGKWLLSYNDCEQVRESYKDYNKIELIGYNSVNLKKEGAERLKRKELLIANYDLGAFEAPLLTFCKEDGACQQ